MIRTQLKYLAIGFVLLSAFAAHAQVSVSATLVDGSDASASTAFLRFQLYNCGDNIPVFTQSPQVMVRTQFDLKPSSGVISGQVIPNDQIHCGGVASTEWLVTYMKDAVTPIQPAQCFVITSTGGTFNPATYTNVCPNTPLTPPTQLGQLLPVGCSGTAFGQITCLGTPGFIAPVGFQGGYYDVAAGSAPANPASGFFRLFGNSGSGFLACITNLGANCMPSGSSGVGTSSVGCNTVYNTTTTVAGNCSVVDASQFAGADICAKIAAALAALPGQFGIVDARNITGNQPCSANPYAAFSPGQLSWLLLGEVNITTSAAWNVPGGNKIFGFHGEANSGTEGTRLGASNTFPANTPIVSISGGLVAGEIDDMFMSCNSSVTGCVVLSTLSGPFFAKNLRIVTTPSSVGIHLQTSGIIKNILFASPNATSGTDLWLDHCTDLIADDIQLFDGGPVTNGILISGGSRLAIRDVAVSQGTTHGIAIDASGTSSSTFEDVGGGNFGIGGDIVNIAASSSTRSLSFLGLNAVTPGGSNDIISDNVTGHSILANTCPSIAEYILGDGITPGVISTCLAANGIPSVQSSTTATMTADVTVAQNTTTDIFTVASWGTLGVPVTMPSFGCPCRALVSYGAYYSGATAGVANTWVNDGTNNFAQSQVLVTGSASNFGANGSGFSQGTYANGANVTFKLRVNTSNSGGITVTHLPNAGPENTWMNVAIMPSN